MTCNWFCIRIKLVLPIVYILGSAFEVGCVAHEMEFCIFDSVFLLGCLCIVVSWFLWHGMFGFKCYYCGRLASSSLSSFRGAQSDWWGISPSPPIR